MKKETKQTTNNQQQESNKLSKNAKRKMQRAQKYADAIKEEKTAANNSVQIVSYFLSQQSAAFKAAVTGIKAAKVAEEVAKRYPKGIDESKKHISFHYIAQYYEKAIKERAYDAKAEGHKEALQYFAGMQEQNQ